MKKRLILFTVLLLSSIGSQAHSFDICEEAAKGLTVSLVEFNQYFNSSLKNHNAAGHGKIRDVFPTGNSNEYLLVLDCGNNVLLRMTSGSGVLQNLKAGQEVSFSAEVREWRKRFFKDMESWYIEIIFGNSHITY